jgi:SAM-dependent methyltransferase
MGRSFAYRFEPVDRCVMCGSGEAQILGRRLNGHQGLRPRRVGGIATTIARCRDCGLIFSDPRPVPGTLEQHYELPPEEYWRDAQLAANDAGHGIPTDVFRRLWPGKARPRALDIGAGLGQTMAALDRDGFEAFGFEPSAPFRDRAIERGIDPERLKLGAVEDAEYEPGSFDLVSFGAVLEHVHNPAAALERALAWLSPGGLMFVEVPSARWLMGRLLNATYRARGLDYVTNLSPMHPPYHLYEFTRRSFAEHGRHAGYVVRECDILPCETFLPPRLQPIAQRVMAATDTGMQLRVWLSAGDRGPMGPLRESDSRGQVAAGGLSPTAPAGVPGASSRSRRAPPRARSHP